MCVVCLWLCLNLLSLLPPLHNTNHQVWLQIYWASALLLSNATSPWLDLGIGRYDLACSMLGLLNSWHEQELRKLWGGWKNRMSTLYRTRKSALCILMLDSNSIYLLYPKATEDKMWSPNSLPYASKLISFLRTIKGKTIIWVHVSLFLSTPIFENSASGVRLCICNACMWPMKTRTSLKNPRSTIMANRNKLNCSLVSICFRTALTRVVNILNMPARVFKNYCTKV